MIRERWTVAGVVVYLDAPTRKVAGIGADGTAYLEVAVDLGSPLAQLLADGCAAVVDVVGPLGAVTFWSGTLERVQIGPSAVTARCRASLWDDGCPSTLDG